MYCITEFLVFPSSIWPWIGISLAFLVAAGDTLAQSVTNTTIEEIQVVGARLPRPVQSVAGKVDVITHETLANTLASDLSDVIRYTPGISTVDGSSRFGNSELTIRGMTGNRVEILVNGVPVPDHFDIGEFSNAGQDYIDTGSVSRVEILRGPASTLFGNDALGGVIAIQTRDPEEYLGKNNQHYGTSMSYSGRDDSVTISASTAMARAQVSAVVNGSYSLGHETGRSAVIVPDAQNRYKRSLYARSAYRFMDGNTLRLEASLFDEDVSTDVRSVLGYGRRYANTTSLTGQDDKRRLAAVIGYDFFDTAWSETGRANLYWQKVDIDQDTVDTRSPLNLRLEREFNYDVTSFGLTLDLDSRFVTGNLTHRLGWGISLERSEISESRDGTSLDLVTGARSNVILGEVYPVRDFPDSSVNEAAFYLHDEIEIGALTLIPGLRYEYYQLDASSDAVFREDNPQTRVHDLDESSLSPKLGLLWDLTDSLQVYSQYAYGFRAPPFEDVNIGFDIPLFNYRAIPNPDLKSETSNSVEAGARYTTGTFRVNATAFGVWYDNLIESRVNLGLDPSGTLIFQSRNIDAARVYGLEFDLHVSMSRWLQGLSAGLSGSVMRGDNLTTGEPLNTVDPAELVFSLAWQYDDWLRLAMNTTAVAAKDRIDNSRVDLATTDSYVLVDLMGSIQVNDSVRINTGVYNVFDKTHWRWSHVRNRTTNDPMLNALSGAGRYAGVMVRVDL